MKNTYMIPMAEIISLVCEDVLTLSLATKAAAYGEDDIRIRFD